MNTFKLVTKIRACEGYPAAQLLLENALNNMKLQTIEECAKHIETPDKNTNYNWVPHSLYGNMVKTIAGKIRSLVNTLV